MKTILAFLFLCFCLGGTIVYSQKHTKKKHSKGIKDLRISEVAGLNIRPSKEDGRRPASISKSPHKVYYGGYCRGPFGKEYGILDEDYADCLSNTGRFGSKGPFPRRKGLSIEMWLGD